MSEDQLLTGELEPTDQWYGRVATRTPRLLRLLLHYAVLIDEFVAGGFKGPP
jgi:hypothetical protein